MVANYRCTEIKDESLELVQEKIEKIRIESEKGLV